MQTLTTLSSYLGQLLSVEIQASARVPARIPRSVRWQAISHRPLRCMAQIGRAGTLQLLRGSRKPRQPQRVPHADSSVLALGTTSS